MFLFMCMYVWLHMDICLVCVQTERQDDFHKFKGSKVYIAISRPVKVLATVPQQKQRKRKKEEEMWDEHYGKQTHSLS